MKLLFIVIIILINYLELINGYTSGCHCIIEDYCSPISVGNRREFIGFTSNNSSGNYLNYDYYSVSTIAVPYNEINEIPNELNCFSHANFVRVVWIVNYPLEQLDNELYQIKYLDQLINDTIIHFMDGIIFDITEYNNDFTNLSQNQINGFYNLIETTYSKLKELNLNYQISVTVPFKPVNRDNFDYVKISNITDYLIIMDYNISSGCDGSEGIAYANSPNNLVKSGYLEYTESIGIEGSKLVLNFPWFGLDFICDVIDNLTIIECPISKDPTVIAFGDILKLYGNYNISTGGYQWSFNSQSPFFNYLDDQRNVHQIWYDDPKSLSIKVWLTNSLKSRGIAVYSMDNLDFNDKITSYFMYDTMEFIFA